MLAHRLILSNKASRVDARTLHAQKRLNCALSLLLLTANTSIGGLIPLIASCEHATSCWCLQAGRGGLCIRDAVSETRLAAIADHMACIVC